LHSISLSIPEVLQISTNLILQSSVFLSPIRTVSLIAPAAVRPVAIIIPTARRSIPGIEITKRIGIITVVIGVTKSTGIPLITEIPVITEIAIINPTGIPIAINIPVPSGFGPIPLIAISPIQMLS
jgi:hypothetical protein